MPVLPPSPLPPHLQRLADLAASRPETPALRHKRRGAWHVWAWREVADEVERLAVGLERLGLERGAALVLVGQVTPRLVLASLAAELRGARPLWLSADADPAAAIGRERIRVALVQGRPVLESWLAAGGVTVVFDHATPDGRSPADRAVPYESVRQVAPAVPRLRGGAAASVAQGAGARIWIEETTAAGSAVEAAIGHWLDQGGVLGAPETIQAAARDRAELQPTTLFATAAGLERVAASLAERLPERGGWTGRLVLRAQGAVETDAAGPFARWLVGRVHARLGLARVRDVTLLDAVPLSAEARRLLAGLTRAEPADLRRALVAAPLAGRVA